MPGSDRAGGAAISLRGVRKSFGSTVAVAGVDLDVASGEIVALLGPNGAGKSTTIDMLLGLLPPDAGEVHLGGLPPARACAEGYVGALQQTGGLLGSVTVGELVRLMCRLSPHPLPVDEVLAAARVADLSGERADRLSGGQAQRVRFALAIAGDPALLVLDEPTVAMDVATRQGFWAAMRSWTARGRTVLFATHYLEEADAFADRAVLMASGRVVADGPTAELRASVTGRTIRATIPEVTEDALRALPHVSGVELRGDVALVRSADSDLTLRHLLGSFPGAREIEVTSGGLEDAFLALTASDGPGDGPGR